MKTGSLQIQNLDDKPKPKKKAVAKKVSTKPAKKAAPKKAVTKTPEKKETLKPKKARPTKKHVSAFKDHHHSHTSTAKPISRKEIGTIRRQPLGHLLVEQKLRENGFRGGISSNKEILSKYSTDESIFSIRPQIVVQPKNQRDVEIAVSVLGKETVNFPSLSLTPRAAGTGLSGGSLTDSIVIDVCTHMHKIHEPVKNKHGVTITVEPGAMWRNIEKELKKQHVYLPSYPASKDICSIGGAIANNAAGPDSLRYGHCADWVESLDVTLYDGNTYTIRPITYREYNSLIKKKNAYAIILREVFELIQKNEKAIYAAEPKTKKNSAGYALWDVMSDTVSNFKKGKGTMDVTRLISGSQGTIGVITSITLLTEPIKDDTELIVIPVFDLQDAGKVIVKALDYDPVNVELFDGLTFDLALKNPDFFKDRLDSVEYYKVLLSMYTMYHVRYARKIPEFTLLVTLDHSKLQKTSAKSIVKILQSNHGKRARLVSNKTEKEMFWQIRRASYTLSKFQDKNKRPAAFLEDMVVPPQNLPRFFVEIKKLLKKYNITAAVHGHGGNGHLHFYPLLDFTNKTTPALVVKMADEFFATAVKFDGNLCGEHNDGIIRTPHLSKMFSKVAIGLFESVEHIFDPEDIFNPGKKVHPRFDIKDSIRHSN